jgi:glycerol kinase
VPVTRPANPETTALGAAYLAGLAVEYWPDQETIAAMWGADRRFTPSITQTVRLERQAAWTRARERASKWDQ